MKQNPSSILSAIGNTPVVRLNKIVPAGAAEVWVKLESVNPTGSYKDRFVAAHVLLSEILGFQEPVNAASWNGLRVNLLTNGSVVIPASQRAKLSRKWKNLAARLDSSS